MDSSKMKKGKPHNSHRSDLGGMSNESAENNVGIRMSTLGRTNEGSCDLEDIIGNEEVKHDSTYKGKKVKYDPWDEE